MSEGMTEVIAAHDGVEFEMADYEYLKAIKCECGAILDDLTSLPPTPAEDLLAAHVAEELAKAGFRKPRAITTVEELDALPDGTIIRDECGPIERYTSASSGKQGWYVGGNQTTPILPAIVLQESEEAPHGID